MKALLLKDFYNLAKQGKIIILLLVFYSLFGMLTGSSTFIIGMITVCSAILPISSFNYDEYAKWDLYALAMPVSRKQIVLSKYLLALIAIGGGVLYSIISHFFVNLSNDAATHSSLGEIVFNIACCTLLCLLLHVVLLPIIIKVGPEKGRIAMFAIFFIPALLVLLFVKMNIQIPSMIFYDDHFLIILAIATPIIVLLLLVASFFLSLHFYNNKEF